MRYAHDPTTQVISATTAYECGSELHTAIGQPTTARLGA